MSMIVLRSQRKKRKILIKFDNMITDVISNEKLHLVVTELFMAP